MCKHDALEIISVRILKMMIIVELGWEREGGLNITKFRFYTLHTYTSLRFFILPSSMKITTDELHVRVNAGETVFFNIPRGYQNCLVVNIMALVALLCVLWVSTTCVLRLNAYVSERSLPYWVSKLTLYIKINNGVYSAYVDEFYNII